SKAINNHNAGTPDGTHTRGLEDLPAGRVIHVLTIPVADIPGAHSVNGNHRHVVAALLLHSTKALIQSLAGQVMLTNGLNNLLGHNSGTNGIPASFLL